jgi:cytochrome c-type biogenesis protein
MAFDQIFLALLFGLLSFVSPCVLPMVPAYISLMSGISVQQLRGDVGGGKVKRGLVMLHSLMFILGFSDVFVLLFYVFKALGLIIPDFSMWLNLVGGFVVLIFGLHMIGILRIRFLDISAAVTLKAKRMSLVGSFIMGFSFALGWSPCTGPFLAGIMTMAMTPGASSYWGLLLIAFYALGMGIPFFLTGLATHTLLGVFGWIKSHYKVVEIFSGVLLAALAVILLSDPIMKWTTGEGTGGIAIISNLFIPSTGGEEGTVDTTGAATAKLTGPAQAPAVGKKLPAFDVTTEDGTTIKFPDDFKDKKVLFVDFWGTWCLDCLEEMPEIVALQEKYKDDLQVVGLAARSKAKDVKRKAANLKDAQGNKVEINYLLAVDDEIWSSYGVTEFPTAILVSKSGEITNIVSGRQTGEQLDTLYQNAASGEAASREVNWNILYIFLGLHVVAIVVFIIIRATKKKTEPEAA